MTEHIDRFLNGFLVMATIVAPLMLLAVMGYAFYKLVGFEGVAAYVIGVVLFIVAAYLVGWWLG